MTGSGSPYLLKAARSPVNWWGWCSEAFELARRENKPVLVDVGASWCHWCNVMDESTYDDPEVARIINESFVPIKVDRDERPDIDKILQGVASSLSGQAGWPLTVFLTPSGKAIFAGTYFPPRDSMGLPGMPRVLEAVLKAYGGGGGVSISGAQTAGDHVDRVDLSAINGVLLRIMDMYDEEHGGFGSFPKFPQVTFHALLLYRGFYSNSTFIDAVVRTLEAMGRGGVRDQLGGGFHRYSVDDAWLIPHFEKLLIDNAELSMNYIEAFAATGSEYLKYVAVDTLNYINSVLGDDEGGYYSSQGADSGGEEGGYYKWSMEELASILTQEELQLVYEHFGLNRFPSGEKAVLHVPRDSSTGDSEALRAAINKMRIAREGREKPPVDHTIYANSTAAAAVAGLAAGNYVDPAFADRALAAVGFLASRLINDGLVRRGYRNGKLLGPGYLDDQAYTVLALLSAFQRTGDRKYLELAVACGRGLRAFMSGQGLLYSIQDGDAALRVPIDPLGDSPNWSPASIAVLAMDVLSRIVSGAPSPDAEAVIKALYGEAVRFGPFAASFFVAVGDHFLDPPRVVIVGSGDEKFEELHEAALSVFRPGKLVIPVRGDSLDDLVMDGSIKAMVRRGGTAAYVCAYSQCSMPIDDPIKLRLLITDFARDRYMFLY